MLTSDLSQPQSNHSVAFMDKERSCPPRVKTLHRTHGGCGGSVQIPSLELCMMSDSHTISCRNSLRQQRKELNAPDQSFSIALTRIEESDTIIKMILGNAIPNPSEQ